MKSFVAFVVFKQGYVPWFPSSAQFSCTWIQDMNYQGSTCICRVPKAQVRTGTVVECVHCGRPIPSLSYPSINVIAKVVAAAVPILDVFGELP
jgi:hypothetical protein